VSSFGPTAYNIDINQLGASQFPRFAVTQPTPYQDGLVEDVILNELHPQYAADGSNVGMIQVRFIPGDRGVPKDKLNWVSPIDSSIREYPLKNELVLIFYSLGRLFYTRRINSTNKTTESSWPGLSERFSPQIRSDNKSDAAQIAAQGGTSYRPWGMKQQFSLGDEFSESPFVRMVRPNEGDLIINGRFGNTIRFGSSLFSNPNTPTPQANLIFSVGQSPNKVTSIDINNDGINETVAGSPYGLTYEDINKDRSSFWMVVNEKIVLDPATKSTIAHLRSTESSDSTKYTGAQIFLNSDRVILNSKVNEISLFAKKEINLSAVESITIDSAKSVFITAERDIEISTPRDLVLSGRSVSINVTKDIAQGTSGNYIISGKTIFIGASPNDTTQPMVLGGELATWLRDLALALSTATVITATGPAFFNPTVTAKLVELLTKLGVPGIPQSAIFNSTSNFTSKTNN
jgi:hypothetical protein